MSTTSMHTSTTAIPTDANIRPGSFDIPCEETLVEDSQHEEDSGLVLDDSDSIGSDELELDLISHGPLTAARSLGASRSHSQPPLQTPRTLFPPFYNRPPTPLPPSPSLTSLLRPSFSSAHSRRTTPESSDVDAPASSLNASRTAGTRNSSTTNLATSARHAPTVPRASPKVPTYEYYGFALYLGSSAALLMYILWAYVPAPLLHQMGIHYYPNRWWALAVPCWLAVLVMYIFVALASYNTGYLTLRLNSCENLVDECAQIAVIDRETGKIVRETHRLAEQEDMDETAGPGEFRSRSTPMSTFQFDASSNTDWKSFWSTGTDAVMDVPIGGVCELLYGSED